MSILYRCVFLLTEQHIFSSEDSAYAILFFIYLLGLPLACLLNDRAVSPKHSFLCVESHPTLKSFLLHAIIYFIRRAYFFPPYCSQGMLSVFRVFCFCFETKNAPSAAGAPRCSLFKLACFYFSFSKRRNRSCQGNTIY